MNLIFNTTNYGKVEFELVNKKKTFKKSYRVTPQESDKILENLEAFLKIPKIKNPISKIRKIIVYKKNTGSFTGLRIAVAVAVALSLAWGVPVRVVKKNPA